MPCEPSSSLGLGGVGPRGQHHQRPVAPGLQGVVQADPADEHAGDADGAFDAEVLHELGTAQVGLDEHDLEAGLGEGDREVGGRRRLALLRDRGGDDDRLDRVVDVDELQVRTQLAEGLGARRVRVGLHDERALGRVGVEADDAEHGALAGGLELLGALDAGVEHLEQDGEGDAEREAEQDAQAEVDLLVAGRRGRSAAAPPGPG